jgi:hypothetical protein
MTTEREKTTNTVEVLREFVNSYIIFRKQLNNDIKYLSDDSKEKLMKTDSILRKLINKDGNKSN